MKLGLRLLVAVSCIPGASCVAAQPASPDPAHTVEVAPPASPDAALRARLDAPPVRRDEPEPPSTLAGWRLPLSKGPFIGQPCQPQPVSARPSALETCGVRGRVAIEAQAQRLYEAPPCELRAFERPLRAGRAAPHVHRLCVDGDHLLIEMACVVCREDSAEAYHVKMSELSPSQAERLGLVLVLRDAPRTADEWRALAASAQDSDASATTLP